MQKPAPKIHTLDFAAEVASPLLPKYAPSLATKESVKHQSKEEGEIAGPSYFQCAVFSDNQRLFPLHREEFEKRSNLMDLLLNCRESLKTVLGQVNNRHFKGYMHQSCRG